MATAGTDKKKVATTHMSRETNRVLKLCRQAHCAPSSLAQVLAL
jgi:hypothetical protein